MAERTSFSYAAVFIARPNLYTDTGPTESTDTD